MAEDKMILTQEGYKKLQEEYRNLIDVERPDVIQAIKEARAQGDLSENSEYDAARDRQAKVESRITEIEHIFDVAIVVDSSSEGTSSPIVTFPPTRSAPLSWSPRSKPIHSPNRSLTFPTNPLSVRPLWVRFQVPEFQSNLQIHTKSKSSKLPKKPLLNKISQKLKATINSWLFSSF